jgi:hypothetical protein
VCLQHRDRNVRVDLDLLTGLPGQYEHLYSSLKRLLIIRQAVSGPTVARLADGELATRAPTPWSYWNQHTAAHGAA